MAKGERLLRDTTVELRRMRLGIQTAAPDPAPTEVALDEPFASEGFCSGSSAAPDTAGSQPITRLEDSVWADRVRPPAAPTGRSRRMSRVSADSGAPPSVLTTAPCSGVQAAFDVDEWQAFDTDESLRALLDRDWSVARTTRGLEWFVLQVIATGCC